MRGNRGLPGVEEVMEKRNLRRSAAPLLVSMHLAVLLAHGSVHSHLNIGLGIWQKAFIAIIIFMVPVAATVKV